MSFSGCTPGNYELKINSLDMTSVCLDNYLSTPEIFTLTQFLLSVFTGAEKQSLAYVQASQGQGVASP